MEEEKPDTHDRIRINAGMFTAAELVTRCNSLLKTKKFIVLEDEFPNSDKNEIEKAVYEVTSSPKFMLDTTPYHKRWLIKRNPSYKNEILHDAKVALIGALLALITGYVLWLIDNRSKSREMERVNDRLEQVEHKLDSLSNK